MAFDIYDNAFLSIDGNDISAYMDSCELTSEREAQDDTTMGDDTRSNLMGLKNWTFNVSFKQDFAASDLDSIIWPLFDAANPSYAVVFRPDAGAVSTSNPSYTGNGAISNYVPSTGSVGDIKTASITIVPAKGTGNATLVRATS